MIRFFVEHKEFSLPRGFKSQSRRIIETICCDYSRSVSELNIVLLSDKNLLQINQDFLHHDYYTDIITFDYSVESVIKGELYISVDRVKENSLVFNVNFIDELKRVLIHGILHLVGLDDNTDEEKAIMREKENYYLKLWQDLPKNGI